MSSETKKSWLALVAVGLMVGVLAAGWGIAAIAEVSTTLSGGNEAPAVAAPGVGGTLASIQRAAARKIQPASAPSFGDEARERAGGGALLACVTAGCNRPSSGGPKG